MKSFVIALCVLGAGLCAIPRCDAGPLGRALSAPVRGLRAVAGVRGARRRAGLLPRQVVARGAAYGFAGGCAGGSCR